jgi:protocatechuate 3,4-dioxygenase beta subunit
VSISRTPGGSPGQLRFNPYKEAVTMRAHQPVIIARRSLLRAWLTLAAPLLAACGGPAADTAPATPVATASLAPTAAPPAATPAATPATPARPAPAPTAMPTPTTAPATPTRPAVTQPAAAALPPTPACGDGPTPSQTAGPYFTPNSPQRASLLEPGLRGTRLTITGLVLSTACRPVARALLDFWQADAAGAYDNAGFRLRGHQFAGEAGRYRLETVVPGLYPGRTRHIHVRVQAPDGPLLTTQLYFPGEVRNATDPIFNPRLVLAVQEAADGLQATFDFVLDLK